MELYYVDLGQQPLYSLHYHWYYEECHDYDAQCSQCWLV